MPQPIVDRDILHADMTRDSAWLGHSDFSVTQRQSAWHTLENDTVTAIWSHSIQGDVLEPTGGVRAPSVDDNLCGHTNTANLPHGPRDGQGPWTSSCMCGLKRVFYGIPGLGTLQFCF